MTAKEEDLLTLLETIILMQMLIENLETLQNSHYNKMRLKVKLKDMIKEVSPLVERDYGIVFSNGEAESQEIIREYEKLVSYISLQKLPSKVALSQMVECFNLEPKTMEANCHRIIKKHSK